MYTLHGYNESEITAYEHYNRLGIRFCFLGIHTICAHYTLNHELQINSFVTTFSLLFFNGFCMSSDIINRRRMPSLEGSKHPIGCNDEGQVYRQLDIQTHVCTWDGICKRDNS